MLDARPACNIMVTFTPGAKDVEVHESFRVSGLSDGSGDMNVPVQEKSLSPGDSPDETDSTTDVVFEEGGYGW